MRVFFRCVAILAVVACLWGGAGFFSKARAATCSFTVTNVAFGSVDVTANAAVDTTATVSITCSGLALLTVQVCVNLGAGSGGATNAANRFMKSGANQLRYSLYSDPARTAVPASPMLNVQRLKAQTIAPISFETWFMTSTSNMCAAPPARS